MRRYAILLITAILGLLGCSEKLEGPSDVKVEDKTLEYCGSDRQVLSLTGTGLSPMVEDGATSNPKLVMPKVCLTPQDASVPAPTCKGGTLSGSTCCLADDDVQWKSQSEIEFTLRRDLGLKPGVYTVTVTNPDGTKASGNVTVSVTTGGPIIFWVEPTVVYNGISTRITLFGANLGSIDQVVLEESGNADAQEIVLDNVATVSPLFNRVLATVPQGTAAGTYDVTARKVGGCETTLFRGLQIVGEVNLTLNSIEPSFGWKDQETSVTITGEGFQSVPRAYLNPVSGTDVAASLESTAMVSGTTLTAVVPKDLPVTDYKLIVVNPDGKVGILEDPVFKVTELAPPRVDNISPSYLDNGGVQNTTVDGANFHNPTAQATCKAPDGTTTTIDGTVAAGSETTFDMTLDTSSLVAGSVCVVRVTNEDGSYYDYSALGITNPSLNLTAFVAGTDMTTARIAPAVASGRATNSARFVYAIGGSDGANALSSVESAPIDIFGAPGTWAQQLRQGNLPEARSHAGVFRIKNFLYLAGGRTGGAPSAKVNRAEVLNPLQAPKILDVAVRGCAAGERWDPNISQCVEDAAAPVEGIGAGVWYYRVSALMADDDPSNPGGETLPSEALVINLTPEALGDKHVVITLFWSAVPNAKAYRIYRNALGTEPVGSELLLAEVPVAETLSYEDVATAPPAGDPPLPLGSLGVWKAMPDLATARDSFGFAAGPDPADANTWHLYAMGGNGGSALASVERLTITIDPATGVQTAAASWAAEADLSSARSELSGYSVGHGEAVQVPAGTTYIYAGGGNGSNDVDAAEITAGGALAWSTPNTISPNQAGYAGVAGAEWLFAFGGQQGNPGTKVDSGRVSNPPAMDNWQPQGGTQLLVPRYLSGATVESAFIFVVGGETTGGAATATTERTVL